MSCCEVEDPWVSATAQVDRSEAMGPRLRGDDSYPRRVNGSTRWAARMKATMMTTPIANSTACRICAPVSSRPNRIASAQPPAKAAPNTSAPIRIAALMTVTTLLQTIWRDAVGEGCELMAKGPVEGCNLSEKGRAIKRKRPKKAGSRDIHKPIFSRQNGPKNGTQDRTTLM